MLLPILASFLLSGPAQADDCSQAALARIASAQTLLEQSLSTEDIDRSATVERARILLERTMEDDPGCRDARSLHRKASRMLRAAEPISQAASLEAALMHALERVEALEQAPEPARDEIEVLRFMLAELGRLYPEDDERITALVRRVHALDEGGEK